MRSSKISFCGHYFEVDEYIDLKYLKYIESVW